MTNNSDNRGMTAFLCDTPLSVFNAIVFVLNNELKSKGNSDLYIWGLFRDSELLAERISQSGVFKKVYFIHSFLDQKKTLILHKIDALFFPKHMLKKYSNGTIDFDVHYVNICFFSTELFSLACLRNFKYDNLIRLDDGASSYVGNIMLRASKKLIYFDKYIFRGKLIRPFTKLYLNCPDFYKGELTSIICQSPRIPESGVIRDTLFQIFQYQENELYHNHEIVFLTQPFTEHYIGEAEEKILKLLQNIYKENFLVRIHPRQKVNNYEKFCIDRINNMWELECLKQLNERNILIGTYSTAQIFPKLLFDIEPYVIFLYKLLFDNVSKNSYCEAAELMIQSLMNVYRNKDKIFVPATFEELEDILKRLDHERLKYTSD